MYTQYWKLKENPFELTPDPRYLFFSHEHEDALTKLIYTVKYLKGAMMLTGLFGCGKTILSRVFLNELIAANYEVALITNPRLSVNELFQEMIYQLSGELATDKSKGELLHMFNEIIYANLNTNRETVVVIDEAQAIKDLETFEELRLLLNFQQDDRFLFTLILIGQSELRKILKQLPQLKQRLMIEHHLNPLSEADAGRYIDHRLRVAGCERSLFNQEAKQMIYRFSGGTPRIINGIADMALLEGYTQKKEIVDAELIKKVVNDAQLESRWAS